MNDPAEMLIPAPELPAYSAALNIQVLANYLQCLASNENRPGFERESLSAASAGVLRLQGEASVLRLLLTEAAELIDSMLSDFGLDFEDIDDKVRLLGQIRRALGVAS